MVHTYFVKKKNIKKTVEQYKVTLSEDIANYLTDCIILMQDFMSEHELNRVLTKEKKVRLKNKKCEANGKKKPLTNSHKDKVPEQERGRDL